MILPDYQITAVNDALTSENRIHSDEIARKFGFTGALCSGVSVFGYLTHPLIAALGSDWTRGTVAETRFIKPAYEGELLSIESRQLTDTEKQNHFQVSALNPDGVLLARLESWTPAQLPPVEASIEGFESGEPEQRPEIAWDLIELNKPAPGYVFQVSPEIQRQALETMRDSLANFDPEGEALVHPYLLLKECNQALMRMFVLPAWIHVGSRLIMREPIRVGEDLRVVTIPIEKWEHKGHQFIRLYVAFHKGDKVAMEVYHTAIFRIAS